MKNQIRELSITNALTDAYLILQEVRDLKINLSIELQAVRDDRRRQAKEWAQLMAEQCATLREIQAQFRIDATLLHLIEPERAAKQGPQNGKDEETLPNWS